MDIDDETEKIRALQKQRNKARRLRAELWVWTADAVLIGLAEQIVVRLDVLLAPYERRFTNEETE